jgi:hypothetical protein
MVSEDMRLRYRGLVRHNGRYIVSVYVLAYYSS